MHTTALSTRDDAIATALAGLKDGSFRADLARCVAIPTVSREPEHIADVERYLRDEIEPICERLGFQVAYYRRTETPLPFMLASRIENPALPTVLMYGHGDVVSGLEQQWTPGLSPFALQERHGRYYGRGTADNKGQHLVNLAALAAVLDTVGSLGFNVKYLFEMGEECGSPGLAELCADRKDDFDADLFIASDGPRISEDEATMFLGSRGALDFYLEVHERANFLHSGNWGGLVANPGVELCHAIAALIGPTGQCLVPELTPGTIPADIRKSLESCHIKAPAENVSLDEWWGEPGLTQAERVYAWSTLEVMDIEVGNIKSPIGAIPPSARARLELRFPLGVDADGVLSAVSRKLESAGCSRVKATPTGSMPFPASRSELGNEWVTFAARSMERTLARKPQIIPNFGGALPNHVFAQTLGLPTIWIPHSYPGCGQHGADEHLPVSIIAEGLAIMTGLFWDIGHQPG